MMGSARGGKPPEKERRRFPRTKVVASVRVFINDEGCRATLVDISIGGALMVAEIDLVPSGNEDTVTPRVEVGDPVSMDIPRLRLYNLRGRVVRTNASGIGHHVAVEFEKLEPAVPLRIIERFAKAR